MVDLSANNDERIKYLLYKVRNNQATYEEKKEYVDRLYEGGYLTIEEYNQYKAELDKEKPSTGKTLVQIGLAVLVGVLLGELFAKKD